MAAEQIPTTKFARGRVVSGALLKAGGKHLGHITRRSFLSAFETAKDKKKLDEDTAKLAFDTFTKLRGTALKIAQMLSLETNILPEAVRKELSRSYHQVPPLGRTLVRKLLKQEFDRTADQLFSRFEPQAFAAASLGQVHAACDEQGRELAVKLQYPGIDVTIDNDLQIVRALVKRSQYAELLLASLDEIEARLHEETNYATEADNTEWFHARLQLDGVRIPDVYRAFSSTRVLTTSRLHGLHLEQWLATNPTQTQRDHFAQRLYDTFVQSFYGLQALQADPNPGNYLFLEDGELGLLDFGCVRHFSPAFVNLMPRLLRAYQCNNARAVMALYAELGIACSVPQSKQQDFYDQYLRPFGAWVTRPFEHAVFDFGQQQNPDIKEGFESIRKIAREASFDSTAKDSMANEFIFYNRTFFGLYQIFERMRANVRMQHRWMEQ